MNDAFAINLVQRLRRAVGWRVDSMRTRVCEMQSDGLMDRLRCRLELGFELPPLETMQNYKRLKFLHDCIVRFAPSEGVALEVGCYKCSSTVFIAKACEKAGVQKIFAMDLFTEPLRGNCRTTTSSSRSRNSCDTG